MKNNLIIVILMSSVITFGCVDKSGKKQSKKAPEIIEKSNKPIEAFLKRKNCTLSFDVFFKKFAKDSIFQKSSIKLPLEYGHYDYLSDEYDLKFEYIDDISDYNYINFSADDKALNKEYDKYTIEIDKSDDEVIYKRVGYDNGILQTYKFKKIESCWYLVSILDEST